MFIWFEYQKKVSCWLIHLPDWPTIYMYLPKIFRHFSLYTFLNLNKPIAQHDNRSECWWNDKKCRPWSNCSYGAVWTGSSLFVLALYPNNKGKYSDLIMYWKLLLFQYPFITLIKFDWNFKAWFQENVLFTLSVFELAGLSKPCRQMRHDRMHHLIRVCHVCHSSNSFRHINR